VGGSPFNQISVNGAGDLAFLVATTRGRAILVKRGVAALEVAAGVGRLSPLEPVRYDTLHQTSAISESAVVAFIADLRDGRHGIFRYDAVIDEDAAVHLAGVATIDGSELCEFDDLELSDAGSLAIVADASADCDDDGAPTDPGLFLSTAGGIATIARQGDAAPIPDATYSRFVGRPRMNAGDDVLFQARLAGVAASEALFLRDGATGDVAALVATGDPLPTGGAVGKLLDARLADDGSAVVHVQIKGTSDARYGVFRYAEGIATALLLSSDSPPADQFTPPHRYTVFEPLVGLSSDGTTIGLTARVRDGASPRSKSGVLRCLE
jgi:hypothetical protein